MPAFTSSTALTPFEDLLNSITASIGATAAGDDVTPVIAVADTSYTRAVTFPAGRFTTAPAVTLTLNVLQGSSATFNMAATGITDTGFVASFTRSAPTASTAFNWTAVEKV